LVNSQHPNATNDGPYANSLTYAISGFDGTPALSNDELKAGSASFTVFPNPTARELHLSRRMDVAIYDALGKRMRVERDVVTVNVSDLTPGAYFIRNTEGETLRFVVE